LEQHIGIGSATMIERIEIDWPVGNYIQVFENISPDKHLEIQEGLQTIISSAPRTVHFPHAEQDIIDCAPQ
jgi:hypothetical protein